MNVFKRNISFMAFDLADIFQSPKASHHKLWKQLLEQSLAFARSGNAQGAVPTKVFDVSQIVQAFKYFALGTRIGKVVVSMEDPSSVVSIVPSRHITAFDSEKTYLLIGCFGGLGRSMTKWMMLRGARKFIFLGRSGTTKSEARQLVDDLIAAGANVEVVRGDVANYADVEAAFAVSTSPIGGVVQAAMGLNEALFTSMSHKSWHTSIQPKVQGTWNLHNALNTDGRGDQLDFFLLTSSISGTVGTATESNYCSANAFLDAFARYRNSLGLSAVSVGLGMISEVGYLHEHPEIEKLLKRKGIHSINEDELLQIIDLALANQAPRTWRPSYDNFSNSHLLTGIEFIGLKQQRELGFEGDNHVLADPRASLFAAAFERSTADVAQGTVLLSHELPKEIKDALQAKSDITLTEAVTVIVKKKMANLILLPADKLQPEKKLGEFGLDSMLAAEFRTFVYHALEVDVPFMTLLDKTTSVSSLAALITEQMEEKMKEAS
jgi:NADP-dependent 3-hydroxy acid dehydrogenase YdfG